MLAMVVRRFPPERASFVHRQHHHHDDLVTRLDTLERTAASMIITDKIQGPYAVSQDTVLRGMITRQVTVPAGLSLTVHGMVTGDVIAERGSTVIIHGTVTGAVINQGAQVQIYGTVDAVHDQAIDTTTFVCPNAVVTSIR